MLKSYARLALGILAFVALNGKVSTESQARLGVGEITATSIDAVLFVPQTILKVIVKTGGFILNIFFDIDIDSICDNIDNFSLGRIVVEFLESLFGSTDPDLIKVQKLIDFRAILKPDALDESFFNKDGFFKDFIIEILSVVPFIEAKQTFTDGSSSNYLQLMFNNDGIAFLYLLDKIDWESFKTSMENGEIQELFNCLKAIDFKSMAEGKDNISYDVTTFVDVYLASIDLEKSALLFASDGPMVDLVTVIATNKDDMLALLDSGGNIGYSASYNYFSSNTVFDDLYSATEVIETTIGKSTYLGDMIDGNYENVMSALFHDDFQTFLDKLVA